MFNKIELRELESLCAVRRSKRSVGGRAVTYTLFELRDGHGVSYALSAAEEGYGALCEAGNDRTAAEGLFELICNGEVTPCTLCDVLDDIYSAAAE